MGAGDCAEGEAARALPKSAPPESESMSPRKPQKRGDRSRRKRRFRSPSGGKVLEKANGIIVSLRLPDFRVSWSGSALSLEKDPGTGRTFRVRRAGRVNSGPSHVPGIGDLFVEIGIGSIGV